MDESRSKNEDSESGKMKLENKKIAKSHLESDEINENSLFRGWVDNFNGEIISGWIVSTENPLQPVAVDVFLCGVFILNTVTKFERSDVTKLLRIPVKSGFGISLHSANIKSAQEAMEKLKGVEGEYVNFDEIFDIIVSGTNFKLLNSSSISKSQIIIKELIETLKQKHENTINNSHFGLKKLLLEKEILRSEEASDVRILAYYLPQFHPFDENEEWWGDGFTEWTNVVAAKPHFEGHYQPHLPADLGFYDLRVEETHKKQIKLAQRYGVSGFCYYYYWFSGKTLMTMPIDRHLENKYDFDFCLCWANENWSRRWDGSENEILIGQQHAQEEDVKFIESCLKYFRSERYIKINGAPVIQIYRASLIENCKDVVRRWKEIVRSEGFPDLHVTMVESFGLSDPNMFGCDSSSQFPPHGLVGENYIQDYKDISPGYNGNIYKYNEIVCGEIARPAANHIQFRGCMPSWDNTSRKGLSGNVFAEASPAVFETWLTHIVNHARKHLSPEKRFVFVNAWNEWAEGAHLEPDRKNGHANLIAVRNALSYSNKIIDMLENTDSIDVDIRRFIGGLVNANKLLNESLNNVYSKYGWNINWSASFTRCDQSILKVSNPKYKSNLIIEALNGRNISGISLISLNEQQGLVIEGVVDSAEIALWHSVPLFLSLKPIGINIKEDFRYVASVFDRRIAKSQIESQDANQSLYWHGFSITASLRNLPAGRYEVELLIADTSNINLAISIPANLNIIVG